MRENDDRRSVGCGRGRGVLDAVEAFETRTEQFVKAAGSPHPLAVTVHRDNRVILASSAKTADEALEFVRRHIGQAVVRVGVTQYTAGIGVTDASELTPHLVDACENIRMGTALFGKVWRIVLK